MVVDGKLYSMQPHFGVSLFVYSKTPFQKAGLTAPTEWKQTWGWDTFVANMAQDGLPGGPRGRGLRGPRRGAGP